MTLSIVRENLLTRKGYTPYCGGDYNVCRLPRMRFNGRQFECPICHLETKFECEFIEQYKQAQEKL